jgi:lipopolysaccharide transport protein LptA
VRRGRDILRGLAAVAAAWALGAPAAAAESAPAFGVAAFSTEAPPGAALPDVATLLADRLATRGARRVVGPGELGLDAPGEVDSAMVREWAGRAQVDALVVGRVTRIGSQLSVDVQLRGAKTGEVAHTYVQEVARADALEASIDQLAARIEAGGRELLGGPAVSAGPRLEGGDTPFGFGQWRNDDPLSIASDELEATQQGGKRHLVFHKNVRVRQGEMHMSCVTLEAVYPEGSSQPEQLVATGSVELAHGDQTARCDRAVYDRRRERLTCQGSARFRDGDSQLVGEVIEIDLRHEKVTVKGGASVTIQPETLEQQQVLGGEPS